MNKPGYSRLRLVIRGTVQGVGFRPFVYRLAKELGLNGWVGNSPQGARVEVEGESGALNQLLLRIQKDRPPLCSIQSLEPAWLDGAGFKSFEIRESLDDGEKSAVVLPDMATCPDCLREIFDPADRRYQYPFTNCTNCGPRFSIIESLPYDRANTSMRIFEMCDACRKEYEDPANRRFHAQPNACPQCGPKLEFWEGNLARQGVAAKDPLKQEHQALLAAAQAIQAGKIVAVKGLGGFHLICMASDDNAVQRLRIRKHREEKPLAVMFASLEGVQEACEISQIEERLLQSSEAPIVLLRCRRPSEGRAGEISEFVAPGNSWLGVMLPYTPLHHLLLREIGHPVVATSGNFSDEPICTDEHEAFDRLKDIADYFLVHDRPIVRHVDDSIARIIAGREMLLRRARGYAPLPIRLGHQPKSTKDKVVMGVGGHLKSAVALGVGPQVFVSQHIGDLETEAAYSAFQRVTRDLPALFEADVDEMVADAHPNYLSTQFAQKGDLPVRQIQHHAAHVLSCMAENELAEPVLGVSWDGTGYGLDGTVWGGEFIQVDLSETGMTWKRVAHLRQFPLPGSELAVKEPRRVAVGLLHELRDGCLDEFGDVASCKAFQPNELSVVRQMVQAGLNSPRTSSAGRLFDAVASLIGLRQIIRHEGQAAMALEFAAEGVETNESYPLPVANSDSSKGPGHDQQTGLQNTSSEPITLDWGPLVECVLADVRSGVSTGLISAKFHNSLAEGILQIARRTGLKPVVLSGGCFQNRRLIETTISRLIQSNFRPYWHQRVPANDGGIALGQVVAAVWRAR